MENEVVSITRNGEPGDIAGWGYIAKNERITSMVVGAELKDNHYILFDYGDTMNPRFFGVEDLMIYLYLNLPPTHLKFYLIVRRPYLKQTHRELR